MDMTKTASRVPGFSGGSTDVTWTLKLGSEFIFLMKYELEIFGILVHLIKSKKLKFERSEENEFEATVEPAKTIVCKQRRGLFPEASDD
jgi:hypothetical protein